MSYRILYLPGAEKDLRRLPADVRERARRGIEHLAEDPRAGKPLAGALAPFWSYRVGDYRVVYEIWQEEIVVLIAMIGHRRDVYEKARRRR